MSKFNIVIIGGGGNVAEITGSVLSMNRHNVKFFRFPKYIPVKGTPVRPTRALERLTECAINAQKDKADYIYKGKMV